MFRYLISKSFWISVLVALVIIIVGTLVFFKYLNIYTNHGESLSVPDFRGMELEEATEMIKEKNLNFEIIDSLYNPELSPGSIVDQNPSPLSRVKRNRKIYFVVNKSKAPMVEVPDLRDATLRRAVSILKNQGLVVGDLKYEPDIAQNAVLRLEYQGLPIDPDEKIQKGSTIDLILGDGLTSEKIAIPNLKGMSPVDASFYLKGLGFNIGAIVYDDNVSDSNSVLIYKQNPAYKPELELSIGEAIDIWLMDKEEFESKEKDENNNGGISNDIDSLSRNLRNPR